uniref:Uncharacterized protein n=1 Tax=Prolemur simus TaxID=1328070 RepID=A0A8C8YFY1_PROSS
MTMEASFRALDAFISPSACYRRVLRPTLASRDASASAAIALWSCTGSFTSLISTRSTFIPQSSVASSRVLCWEQTGKLQMAQPRCLQWLYSLGFGADGVLGESCRQLPYGGRNFEAGVGSLGS